MKLLALVIAIDNQDEIKFITKHYKLDNVGYFQINQVKDKLKQIVMETLKYLQLGTRHQIIESGYYCYILISQQSPKVGFFAFCDGDYPRRIAFSFLNIVQEQFYNQNQKQNQNQFDSQEIQELFIKYLDPSKVDKVVIAQQKVDTLNITLHESLQQLLLNQSNLNDLINKSKDLKNWSKEFYKLSRLDYNRRCQCSIF
ncbi:hypothetical protein pb186bvf_013687 [Paramecium bursaria]